MAISRDLVLLWLGASLGLGQGQVARPPSYESPEVDAERRVTFRIWAPKANEVAVTGDWMGRLDKPVALSQGADGVWVGTTGPLEPNAYFYAFTVDGVRAADPVNPSSAMGGGGRFPQSALSVRGGTACVWEVQPVPKGSIHTEYFESALQQRERSYCVYTPPGYADGGRVRYPVLVLLPGTPGTEADWIALGLANRVFDNLIAQRKMRPMVVLMPRADVLVKGGTRADNLREFEPMLLGEVLPHFERRYRAEGNPKERAIAGYSLGGELALTVGLRHPETFRAVGSFGGSLFENEFEERFGRAWAGTDPSARTYRQIWIGFGSGDLLAPGSRKLSEVLKEKKIEHTLKEVTGYHSLPTFRGLLIEFVQALFR